MLRFVLFDRLILALALLGSSRGSSIGTFDYIIVGGGTAGLTVANRLTELSNITVAIVEAGDKVFNNPNVTNLDDFTVALGTPIDWQYESTNQIYAAGQKLAYHSGKALGGTSTINGMTYVRAEKAQIDSWGAIGNKGWNWDSLFPYYEKSEDFEIPTTSQMKAGASYVPRYHGEYGPLKVGYSYGLFNGSFHESVIDTWEKLGIPHNLDVNGGHVRGFTVWQSTLDQEANVREDAARAYYYPVQTRPNLHVVLNVTVNKIVWKGLASEAIADGVEVTDRNSVVSTLTARREVILAAGSLRSPAILELSGVGNPSILRKYGISTVVDLAAVGENLQDQPNTAFYYNANNNVTFNGTLAYVAYGTTSDFLGHYSTNSTVVDWAATVSAAINHSVSTCALEKLFRIQYDLVERSVPDAEMVILTSENIGLGPSGLLGSAFWLLMPFSRGNVHIGSPDPLAYPEINPNYFLIDFDLTVQIAIAKWARRFWMTEPMSDLAAETSPGYEVVPVNATDEQWAEWIKQSFTTNSHPLGTAAMMPRDLGGVVNEKLTVYGTSNIRVVDASVMPFQVSGHLTSTIYAIAEKASDIIKADMWRSS